MDHDVWMLRAIEVARQGIEEGQSPFGAVIVRGSELVAAGHNEVWHQCDPTCHAEVVTIRKAAAATKSIDFSGSVMYSTCEPCPMCASAIHWSKLDAIYYGATIADAREAGFSELVVSIKDLYRLGGSPVRVESSVMQAQCAALFREWLESGKARAY